MIYCDDGRRSHRAYAAFAGYPRRLKIDGCPCCTDPEDQTLLQNGRLEEMPAELMADFAFSAMLTWGDANDVKHFLPRILELAASAEHAYMGLEFWILEDRLDRAGWFDWPPQERAAVATFLCSVASVRHIDSLLPCIAKLGISVTPILEAWTQNPAPFIELTLASAADLMNQGHLPWADVPARAEVEAFLRDELRLVTLEALFAIHADSADGSLIAEAIDILAWIRQHPNSEHPAHPP